MPKTEEITRRNFYLTLFRLYSAIPLSDCVKSFTKIYNDVFIHERPTCVHKYSLAEVMVCELLHSDEEQMAELNVTHKIPFRFNFMGCSSKNVNYLALPTFHTFVTKAIR